MTENYENENTKEYHRKTLETNLPSLKTVIILTAILLLSYVVVMNPVYYLFNTIFEAITIVFSISLLLIVYEYSEGNEFLKDLKLPKLNWYKLFYLIAFLIMLLPTFLLLISTISELSYWLISILGRGFVMLLLTLISALITIAFYHEFNQ